MSEQKYVNSSSNQVSYGKIGVQDFPGGPVVLGIPLPAQGALGFISGPEKIRSN